MLKRPKLLVGFAAETDDVVEHAKAKRKRKGADWIVANDVSPETGTFGGPQNTVHIISDEGVEDWPKMAKDAVAKQLDGATVVKEIVVPGRLVNFVTK